VSVDFQVVFPREAVTLTSAHFIQQTNQLDILGKDFSAVDEVLINDLVSPSILVVSRTRLLAEIPTNLSPGAISSIAVLSRRLTVTPRSILEFRVGRTPSSVRGILKLVQLFLKVLFTTPGQDIFIKSLGGGALRDIGETFGANQGGKIVSDFVVAVDTTTRQLIALQSRDTSLPRDERLLSARVASSAYDRQSSSLIVSVELLSQAGRAATANVVV
jgi:hypothetical protein